MWALTADFLIGALLLAAAVGGVALFTIARQDDSRSGQIFGALLGVAAVLALSYLTVGHHWP
jgi:hypothetical protein